MWMKFLLLLWIQNTRSKKSSTTTKKPSIVLRFWFLGFWHPTQQLNVFLTKKESFFFCWANLRTTHFKKDKNRNFENIQKMPNLIEQANECFSKGDFEGKEDWDSLRRKKTKERRPLTSKNLKIKNWESYNTTLTFIAGIQLLEHELFM